MEMTVMTAVVAGAGALVLAWQLVLCRRALARIEARVDGQAAALALLAETSETGFGAVAREIERAAAPKPAAKRKTAAAPRGRRSVAEVAAAQGLSQGEVALRLKLAGVASAREDGHALRV
jgi:hypothetical protein